MGISMENEASTPSGHCAFKSARVKEMGVVGGTCGTTGTADDSDAGGSGKAFAKFVAGPITGAWVFFVKVFVFWVKETATTQVLSATKAGRCFAAVANFI